MHPQRAENTARVWKDLAARFEEGRPWNQKTPPASSPSSPTSPNGAQARVHNACAHRSTPTAQPWTPAQPGQPGHHKRPRVHNACAHRSAAAAPRTLAQLANGHDEHDEHSSARRHPRLCERARDRRRQIRRQLDKMDTQAPAGTRCPGAARLPAVCVVVQQMQLKQTTIFFENPSTKGHLTPFAARKKSTHRCVNRCVKFVMC